MRWLAIALLLASACTAEIPSIPPEAFACDEDIIELDGRHPCPDSRWCVEGRCVERLFCDVEGAGRPGCVPLSTRCEPVFTNITSAVRCERGVHTSTSVRADAGCDCPDGLHCVVFGTQDPSNGYPLFVVPRDSGATLDDEVEGWRMCARACSSEANCPGNHTCRPAAVLPSVQAVSSTMRHTIGVCFPEQVVTSTTPAESQPSATCQTRTECSARNAGDLCQYRIEEVPDHPTAPMGDAWAGRALVGQCVPPASGLAEDGIGCTASGNCKSGLCVGNSCARTCNPVTKEGCPRGNCSARTVSRTTTNGEEVEDTVFICG